MKTMDRLCKMILLAGVMLGVSVTIQAGGMSMNKVRENTRFLTDRMRYELNLSYSQYNDVYEVNFDYVNNVRHLMPYVVNGEDWAVNDYYRVLDIRNDDLRWILSAGQYTRFISMDYFFRPIYAVGNVWNFRIYLYYDNPGFFYFEAPLNFRSYNGEHYRTRFNNVSFYKTNFGKRYHHPVYQKSHSLHPEITHNSGCYDDFMPRPEKLQARRRIDDKPQSTRQQPTFQVKPGLVRGTVKPDVRQSAFQPNGGQAQSQRVHTGRDEHSRTSSIKGIKEKRQLDKQVSVARNKERVSKKTYYNSSRVQERGNRSGRPRSVN